MGAHKSARSGREREKGAFAMKAVETKRLALCGVCAALTCVLAPFSIPIGQVPISLATFSVMLAAALLGGRLGALSQGIYLLLGCLGVPVFAGFAGGPGVLLGPTGGYLVGYLPLALLTGGVSRALGRGRRLQRTAALVLGMVLGTAALYAFGTAWYVVSAGVPLSAALLTCVVPFLPGDAAKIAAVALVAPQLERALSHFGLLPKAAV